MVRGTLASTTFPLTAGPFMLIAAWAVAGFGASYAVMNRRG